MIVRTVAAATAIALAMPAQAQEEPPTPEHAASGDFIYSTDADDTEVMRAGLNLDFLYRGPEKRYGIRVEKGRFNPLDQGWQSDERVYLRAADGFGDWQWNASVGTDGDTILGSAAIYDRSTARKEFFLEREIVETPQGLQRGIYYTFGGVALDLPADDRNLFTVVVGLQDFTGSNFRAHLRANYIHVLKPDLGLSAQLRTRWFHNSRPREYDYYSPRWYAQVLPLLQLRQTTPSGWRLLFASGLGAQKDSNSKWKRSSYFNAQLTTPATAKGWAATGGILFSETPTTVGQSYNYLQVSLGLTRIF